jgi:flagellar biosynthetic protein FliR
VEPYATSVQVWQGALIFARIGAVLLMLPGIG